MLTQYLKDIFKTYKAGDAGERSYYPDLKKLLESFLVSKGIDPSITIEARKTEAGIPDFTVRKGKELIGYVEAKDLEKNLEEVERSEQVKRYKEKLPNFILTNYLDFWLWRRDGIDESKGQWIKKVKIAQPLIKLIQTMPPPQNETDFFDLFKAFFSYYIPERKTAKALAKELASRANLIPGQIKYLLDDEKEEEIDRIYNAFKSYLIADLTKEDFADIYAQTIAYGLFTARLRYAGKDFNRFLAQELIPKNIRILHDTFHLISHDKLTESLAWIIDDMATVLAHADIDKIREELHQKKGGDDPLMHFYETFLAEYDPRKRKARGVYYTPLPVVSYITRSINILLKEKFNKKLGFADEGVTLLDPASGTLTFPSNAVVIAKKELDKSSSRGSWLQVVKNHILNDFYAFELLMAPYIIGHLKISLLLEDLGYKMQNSDRFKLYLTNTLDLSDIAQSSLPFVAGLSEEAREANMVKKDVPILVIMGNPPYSASHSEQFEFIKGIMKDYLTGLGVEKEKKKGVMQDDYIRFIRFAHWKIEQAGQGIIGFITNNSYLDGFIHRAMRKKLIDDFNEIYILNLHGNSRIGKKTPKGEEDENIFDIQQGVSIVFLIKDNFGNKKIKYLDLWGPRDEKYDFLSNNDINTTQWVELNPKPELFYFIRKGLSSADNYSEFLPLEKIFHQKTNGIVTKRDNLVVDFNRYNLESRINRFISTNGDADYLMQMFSLSSKSDIDPRKARDNLKGKEVKMDVKEYLYRPFDKRWIFYNDQLVSRTRKPPMLNMLRNNLALVVGRAGKNVSSEIWDLLYVSDSISDENLFYRGGTIIYPLFTYSDKNQDDLFGESSIQQSNFNPEFWEKITPSFIETVSSFIIFNYIYAILYSNVYRKKYSEFLKTDFPRIPFTKDSKLFYKISELGEKLVNLHLLKSEELDESTAKFPVSTGNIMTDGRVKERKYRANRIYINNEQYFEGIKPEAWDYCIGGYQVLDKWLKDRIDRILSPEDVSHFLKITTALTHTIEIQKEIDKFYPGVEKNLIDG